MAASQPTPILVFHFNRVESALVGVLLPVMPLFVSLFRKLIQSLSVISGCVASCFTSSAVISETSPPVKLPCLEI